MPSVIPKNFIEDAFIKPIKSVLVIDDEYPVLEGLMQCALDNEPYFKEDSPRKRENAKDLLEFTRECRKRSPGWLVDVHDGSNIPLKLEPSIVKFLTERDLLILDYHLKAGSADLTVNILHALAKSENFNLCVVYSEEDPNTIFSEIVYQFISPRSFNEGQSEETNTHVKAFLSDWEIEEEQVFKNLTNQVAENYLAIWKIGNSKLRGDAGEYAKSIRETIEKRMEDRRPKDKRPKGKQAEERLTSQNVFDYLLDQHERGKEFAKGRVASICDSGAEIKWLRSDNLFVAIVKKKSEGGSRLLIDKMVEALCSWNPSPARLLLNRFRASLDTKGGKAGDYALNYREREAMWLSELLDPDSSDRQSRIEVAIGRHWEILCDEVMEDVLDWANNLFGYLEKLPEPQKWIKEILRVDINDAGQTKKGVFLQNVFACSKNPAGSNLTTGHIIKWNDQYWVCLTPACDLVPGQKNKDPDAPIAFKAVRLHKKTPDEAFGLPLGSAVFLRLDGEDQAFALVGKSDGTGAPDCREFRASKQGRFHPEKKEFVILYSEWDQAKGDVVTTRSEGVVVAQLRYEYALNYLQVLGANLTRIGLDLVKLPKREKAPSKTKTAQPVAGPDADATTSSQP